MKKKIYFLLFFGIINITTHAQSYTYQWAKSIGTNSTAAATNKTQVNSFVLDNSDNLYVVGQFSGTVDVDPGPAVTLLTSAGSNDMFMAKYNSTGALVWSMKMGGAGSDVLNSIAIDASGNLYVGGNFTSNSFNANPMGLLLPTTVTNTGNILTSDVFYAKYNNNGVCSWANKIGGTGIDLLSNLKIDASGNVYLCGIFLSATMEANPALLGSTTLTNAGPALTGDMFFGKYNNNGNYVWAKSLGTPAYDEAYSIDVDNAGNVYIAGYYSNNTLDADPGPGVANLLNMGAADMFIGKYSSTGAYVWAYGIGSPGTDAFTSVTHDASNNIYLTGVYGNTIDMDPGIGVANFSNISPGTADIVIAKYNSNGGYLWAKNMGGRGADILNSISLDASNNIYVSGYYMSDTLDADPGPGVKNLINAGGANNDMFFGKYDNAGNYLWAMSAGGTFDENCKMIRYSAATNSIYTCGYFESTVVDMDASPATNNVVMIGPGNPNTINGFIARYVVCPSTIPAVTITANPGNSVCLGTSVTFTATPANGGAVPQYQWKKNGVNVGTNAPTYSYTPVNGDVITCVMSSNLYCAFPSTANSNSITMIAILNIPAVSIAANPGSSSCAGSTVTYTATPTNGGTAPQYQWKKNGVNVGTNSPTYAYVPSNGDVINCIMTSNAICLSMPTATSNNITQTVYPILVPSVSITSSALNNTVCAGNPVSFTAAPANGGTTPAFQWKKNGVNVGANSPTYIYTPINGDIITCVLTTNYPCPSTPTATSNSITMIVNQPPAITQQPQNTSICANGNGTISISATGTLITYQWEVNTGTGFSAISNGGVYGGATTNALTLTAAPTSMLGYMYRCVVAGVCPPQAISNTIILSFYPLPDAIIAPVSGVTGCDSVVLTASQGLNYTYQWKFNSTNIAGTNNFHYAASATGNYSVLVTNMYGCSRLSSPIAITVHPSPAAYITYNTPLIFCIGGAVALNTYNGGTHTTQWFKDGVSMTGFTADTNVIIETGSYSVKITNEWNCSKISVPVFVQVNPLPNPVITAVFNALSTGTFASYQWYKDNFPIAGANSQTYLASHNGAYKVEVFDNNGCTKTSNIHFFNTEGVKNISGSENISIYPNPAQDIVYIEASSKLNITIRDLAGKEILRKNNTDNINIGCLANGMYMIVLTDSNNNIVKFNKLMKQY